MVGKGKMHLSDLCYFIFNCVASIGKSTCLLIRMADLEELIEKLQKEVIAIGTSASSTVPFGPIYLDTANSIT